MGSTGTSSSAEKPKRGQIENPYDFNDKLVSGGYNKDLFKNFAVQQIKDDTNVSFKEAEQYYNRLVDYLGGNYREYTDGFRQKEIQELDEILSKLPKYNSEIYRGMTFANYDVYTGRLEESDNFKTFLDANIGDELKMKSVSSWTSNEEVSRTFSGVIDSSTVYNSGASVILICDNNKSGAGVQHISKFKDAEAEVLLPSTAKWKIVDKQVTTKADYLMNTLKNQLKSSTSDYDKKYYQQEINDVQKSVADAKNNGRKLDRLVVLRVREV